MMKMLRLTVSSLRLYVYSEDKITPINVGGDEDKAANKNKLIEAEKRRGKKISRLVRRVNGILMQLTTFETATSDEHKRLFRIASILWRTVRVV